MWMVSVFTFMQMIFAGSSLKLRLKLEFYFRNKSCFSFEANLLEKH